MVQPFSHIEEKIELYPINIYIFSFNKAPIQHDTGKTNSLISQSCKPLPYDCSVFELLGTTSNMYFVHVNLMNSVENTKIQKCIKDRLHLM